MQARDEMRPPSDQGCAENCFLLTLDPRHVCSCVLLVIKQANTHTRARENNLKNSRSDTEIVQNIKLL